MPSSPALPDLYHGVLSVVLGQQLPPDTGTNFPSQGFAVAVSVVGLTSFALVLALVEQVGSVGSCHCVWCVDYCSMGVMPLHT